MCNNRIYIKKGKIYFYYKINRQYIHIFSKRIIRHFTYVYVQQQDCFVSSASKYFRTTNVQHFTRIHATIYICIYRQIFNNIIALLQV